MPARGVGWPNFWRRTRHKGLTRWLGSPKPLRSPRPLCRARLVTGRDIRGIAVEDMKQKERQRAFAPEKTEPVKPQPIRSTRPIVGRNEPCPCGSGIKFKRCHLKEQN